MINPGGHTQGRCPQPVSMCTVIHVQTPHTIAGNQYMQGATVKNTITCAIRCVPNDAL